MAPGVSSEEINICQFTVWDYLLAVGAGILGFVILQFIRFMIDRNDDDHRKQNGADGIIINSGEGLA